MKKDLANGIVEEYGVSISRACKMMDIHRSYFYYESVKDDTAVEEAIRKASEHGDGFWKIFEIIRREGHTWNHKKVYRVYKAMHYEKRKRLRKRLPARVKNPLEQPMEPFVTWSIDFVSDVLECGCKSSAYLISSMIAAGLQLHRKYQCRSLLKGSSRCLRK